MGKKQYKVAPEVKTDIPKRIKDDGLTVAKAAEEHGVSTATIYGWLRANAKAAPSWSEFAKLKRERDELIRIIRDITVHMSTTQKKAW